MTTPERGQFTPPKKVHVVQVHGDLSQEVIHITVDRLCLVLHKHAQSIGRQMEWMAPVGIMLTVIGTLVTATFKDWGLKSNDWRAVFVAVGALAAIWLLKTLRHAFGKASVDALVARIKAARVGDD